jgi:hypothetical protein
MDMGADIRHKSPQKFITEIKKNKRDPIFQKKPGAAYKNSSEKSEDKKLIRRKPDSVGNHIDANNKDITESYYLYGAKTGYFFEKAFDQLGKLYFYNLKIR